MDSDEEISSTPPDLKQAALITTANLLPSISKERYDTAYKNFINWKNENNAKSFSENVLLAYFGKLLKNYKSSTLWSIYSMLKTSIIAKHDINIANYLKLKAILKRQSDGYLPKKSNTLNPQEIKQFIDTAPDELYLLTKVALIFGISGALRKIELCNIKLCDLKDLNSALLVMIPVTKNKIPRSFTITGIFYEIYKKYASLRPKHLANPNERFFINYQKGKCTSQFVGINKFGNMVKQIAKFLNLPNPETYTGHSFRRSSATILVDSGGDLLTLKRHGGWQSSAVAEGYVNDSFNKKMEISNRIVQSVELAPALLSSSSSINTEEESLQAQKNQNMGTPEASNILNLAFTSSSNTVQAEQNQLESELSNVPIKPSLRPGSISKHSSSREFKPTTGSQRSLSVPPKIPNPSPSTSKDMSFLEQHFYIDAGVNLPTNSEPNSLNVVDDDKVNLRKLCNNNKVEKINKRYSSVMSTTCLEKNQERKALNRRSLNITSKESSKIPVSYKNFVKTTEKKIVTNNDENKPNNVDFNNSYAVSSSKSNSLVLESNNNSNRGSLKMTSSQLPVVKRRSVSEIGKPF